MKDAIVASHNSWRSTVANGKARKGVNGTHPQASNMMELKWNDELAEVAQRYSKFLKHWYLVGISFNS